MTLSETDDARITEEPDSRQLNITPRLTFTAVPLVVVALLVGLFLVWNLVSGDGPGFGLDDGIAIAVGVVVTVVAVGTLVALYRTGKSMSRDVDSLTVATRTIAHKDLVDLLDTLRSPDPDLAAVAPIHVDTGRGDEIGELARSFEELHRSLIDVAARQMEALRNGVSSIFVTLARRNSSLVDRQLALLDELEAGEEDPRTLGGYYQLDHFATRMRRNAESLLVLAGSESPRVWAKATNMADVVRAAVGEVDEYQRIEVLALEPARLSGGAVSDVSHLVAELLENAIQFSPPSEPVRITGLFVPGGYQLTVSDRGLGMSDARIGEVNRILAKPPGLGLSVEPTLGMYVIAKLAHRHGVDVELIKGVPGLTARVTVPRDHLEIVEEEEPRHWEQALDEERGPRGPEARELTDAATREYVFRRVGTGEEEQPAAAAAKEEVIDLTSPDMTEAGELPVRSPGKTFAPEHEEPVVGSGESAVGLKSALAAYDRGRRAAEEGRDREEEA